MCLERVVSTSVRLWCHNYTRSSPLEAVAVKTWAQLRQKHSGKIGLFQWRALNTQIYSGATTNRKTQPQKAESITLTSAGKGSYVLPLKISAEWMDALSALLTGGRYTVPVCVIINPATFLPRNWPCWLHLLCMTQIVTSHIISVFIAILTGWFMSYFRGQQTDLFGLCLQAR